MVRYPTSSGSSTRQALGSRPPPIRKFVSAKGVVMRRFRSLLFLLLAFAASTYAQITYTSLDFPCGTLTTTRGINNHGDIVGAYRVVPPRHPLLIKHGQYIPLAPNTILGTTLSEAFKINDRGDVVGAWVDDAGFSHGFLLSNRGNVTTLD